MWGLSFPCCLVFPSTWEAATHTSHSTLTEDANPSTTVPFSVNGYDKKFLQVWLLLLYSVYKDPSWLSLFLALRGKKKKTNNNVLWTEQKPPVSVLLFICCLCYTAHTCYLSINSVGQEKCLQSLSPTSPISKLCLPLWACVSESDLLWQLYITCFFLQWLFAFSSLCTFSLCLFTWFPYPGPVLIYLQLSALTLWPIAWDIKKATLSPPAR